jgi:hypothetical protein
MIKLTLLTTVALLASLPAWAIGPQETDDGTDDFRPAGSSVYSTDNSKVYAPRDNRVNAPSSVRKNSTTNNDSRSVSTVGPTTTKVGPSASTGPNTATNGPNTNNNSATAGASTSHGGTIVFTPNITVTPQIAIHNGNSNENSNSNSSWASGGASGVSGAPGLAGAPGAVIPVPVPPLACRLGVIGGLGFDGLGRPIYLNLRTGPSAQYPNVTGPLGEAVIIPDGVRVRVCGRSGNWLQAEVCNQTTCLRGWAFGQYVLGL